MTITLIDGSIGNDILDGTAGADIINGYDGNDRINAGAGDDIIDAGAGTNQIDAGDGQDTILIDGTATNGAVRVPANGIDGGTGYDTAIYAGLSSNYNVTQIVGGYLQVTDLTTGARELMINVEHLQFADTDVFLSAPPANLLLGTAAADTLIGSTGDDSLYGYAGNDSLNGDAGNDYIDAGAGTNRIDGGAGDDTIVGGQGNNGLMQTPANGIVGGDGYDTVSYAGNVASYRITQTAGTGYLTVVNLQTGARDIMTGVESLQFSDTAVVLVQPNAAPTISGTIAATLAEGDAAQSFNALAFATDPDAADILSVTNLAALPTGVTFDAGTQSFSIDPTAANFDALAANQTQTLTIDYAVTDGSHITPTTATFTITGTNDAAVVAGSTTATVAEDATLTANGQLTVTDVDTGEAAFTAITTPLAGAYGALTMDATGAWSYTLDNASAAVQALTAGQTVVDTLTVTTLDGTATQIAITVNGANEPLLGTAGADMINGTAGADDIFGLAGADKLYGRAGDDRLNGGTGADSLYGGDGADSVYYDSADRAVDGGAGTDTLMLTTTASVNLAASDQVAGGSSTVTGFENVDASSSTFVATLAGNAAANTLFGGAAADVITGRGGADTLLGGAGADRFVFLSAADSTAAAADTISDFTAGQDRIDLSAIDAVKGGANNAFTWIDSAAFTAAGQLRYDAASGTLQADVNGDHIADLHVNLINTPMLQATDFLL